MVQKLWYLIYIISMHTVIHPMIHASTLFIESCGTGFYFPDLPLCYEGEDGEFIIIICFCSVCFISDDYCYFPADLF